MAREVKRAASEGFLRRAEEFLSSARDNFAARRLNAAGFDAVQSMVNANDAVTAHFLATVASLEHREAVRLHIDVVRILGDSSQRDALKRALDERSAFGYLGVPASRARVERILRDAARFLEWARRVVGARRA